MSIYLGTSPIANTGYDKANTDLSNLTNTGKNIANWSNNVTNCISEIPQDIKLELNNGTLTLKAGSKVYVPNGFESDGTTLKFDTVTIINDITRNKFGSFTGQTFLTLGSTSSYELISYDPLSQCHTDGTIPSTGNYTQYNTTTNMIKRYNNGSISYDGMTFPIAIITVSSGTVTSIDQVFNGFGYIGSTVFALPGVKGLIPNGRNDDGSLKSVEFTIDSVKTATRTWVDSNFQVWGYTKNPPTGVTETWYFNAYIESDEEPSYNEYVMWYKPSENITYVNNELQSSTPNWEKVNYINFGKASGINSQEIKIFNPKTAFHALDYNDSSTISGWSMPSSRYIALTLGASGATYTAPANGWVFFQDTGNQPYSALVLRTNYIRVSLTPGTNGNPIMSEIMPVKKGDIFYTEYANITGENRLFRFIYAEGEN